jgi:hypothetical protein
MNKSKMSISLETETTRKVMMGWISFGERAKRAIRTVRLEVSNAVQDAAHILRIIVFLHSAEDFPSVLRLYGIEECSETQ